jgi:hypothetical protein
MLCAHVVWKCLTFVEKVGKDTDATHFAAMQSFPKLAANLLNQHKTIL